MKNAFDGLICRRDMAKEKTSENKKDLMCVCVHTQSCLTLCNLMDCSLPGSYGHGIFQVRIQEWVAISYSRGSPWPRDSQQKFLKLKSKGKNLENNRTEYPRSMEQLQNV